MTTDQTAPEPHRTFAAISLLFGGLLVVLGFLALAAPMLTGLGTATTLGVLLSAAGGAGLVAALKEQTPAAGGWAILWALAALVLGLTLVAWPADGAATLALFIGACFAARGLFAIGLAIAGRARFRGWGWVALGGVVTLLFGALILAGWPLDAAFTLGALVAIDLIVYGLAVILGSFGVRG